MNAPKGMKISPKECTALTFCWLIEKIDLVMIVNPSPSFKADPGGGGGGNTGGLGGGHLFLDTGKVLNDLSSTYVLHTQTLQETLVG